MDTFGWPTAHIERLADYYAAAGLVDVAVHKKRPPPTIFRAFYEQWYALNAQLLPVMEAKDAAAGHEARRLLMQMKKDAQADGVYSAHVTKLGIGRRLQLLEQ